MGQFRISSPASLKPLEKLNEGKPYCDKIKPFNFLLTCFVRPLGHPPEADPEHFHLITPYEKDSRQWLKKNWIDQYSGKQYRITTTGGHGDRHTARVKTYGDVLNEYEHHPESKCADAHGDACSKQTVGLLQRRHIRIDQIKYIREGIQQPGRRRRRVDSLSAERLHRMTPDPRRDEWETKILPALKKPQLSNLVEECRGILSRRAIIDLRAGRSRPHRTNRGPLLAVLRKLGRL